MYFYSAEKNVLQLISLLKAHGVKRIVVSPGATNITFVASLQQDKYFELFSCVDERSAAYMACGLAEESGEPVALSCTGATASRNYYPGLTEAYYRKLPILAITSSRSIGQIGQNIDQVTDRTQLANDIAVRSVYIPVPNNKSQEWENNIKINAALIDLKRHGGGPVHINLMTLYTNDFSVKELPQERVIRHYSYGNTFPLLKGSRIGVFVGAHKKWSDKQTEIIDRFCKYYGAVVLYEPGSNYKGEYGVPYNLITWQKSGTSISPFDTLIHIGDVSVFVFSGSKEIWRVNRDGEIRDTFKKLTAVFEMEEEYFFGLYCSIWESKKRKDQYVNMYSLWNNRYEELIQKAENIELPFSNLWVANQSKKMLPKGAELHLGILNSVRSWTLQRIDHSNDVFCNTGGYGIDGGISALIGASLINTKKLYFGVFGDLAFFYDMNSLGNRHIGKNIRLMIINNGMGGEFKNYSNLAQRAGLGEDANCYISAAGHYGNKSKDLIKGYVTALGFRYITADDKETFKVNMDIFFATEITESIVFEIFTNDKLEADAIKMMQTLDMKNVDIAKQTFKQVIGDKNVRKIKKLL